MKVLLIIFVFYIHYVICASDKYAVKSFPKKVKPYGTGKILIHSGKYIIKPKTQKPTSKVNVKNGKYTVFQVVGNSKAVQGVPDSPYFPVDQTIDQKPRVKKVLPDYVWSSLGTRQKREATEEGKTENTSEATIGNKTDTKPTSETSTEKSKSTTESKTDKPESKNEKAEFRSNDKDSNSTSPTDTKKEEANIEKKGSTNPDTKINDTGANKANKTATGVAKSVGTTKKPSTGLRKGKNKTIGRNNSKKGKSNKTRSKTRLRGKPSGRNGTAAKKPKAPGKRQGRAKPKAKQNKKGQLLRQPKTGQAQKRNKTAKSVKKDVVRKGNSTNIKIPKETRRLTAAREALIEDYPYVVSIQKDSEHWCTGALLNPRLVITTANCLWKSNHLSRMEVRAGSSYTDHGGQLAKIQEVIKHPRWGLRKNPDNDLALVLLDRNIRFSHSVHGVDLPNRVMMPAFEDAWIASWGSERRDGIFDLHENALQVYHSYLMSNESCNNVTRRFGISVSDNFICFSQSGKTAPCTRDTGAPAVSDGVLWGLASWGIRKLCGTERFPAMFSYTASHSNMDFIANTTSYMMSDERFYPFVDRPPVARVAKPADTTPA